jgi:hypothetical protein
LETDLTVNKNNIFSNGYDLTVNKNNIFSNGYATVWYYWIGFVRGKQRRV